MATPSSPDRKSATALTLAVLSFLPLGSILIPYLYQEVTTLAVLGVLGLVVAVFAVVMGISAFRAKRKAHEKPWIAALAIGLALLPALAGLLLAGALPCYLTGTACSHSSQPQANLSDQLERVAAKGTSSYFLGRSYAGLELTDIEVEDTAAFYNYGPCRDLGEGSCSNSIQVHSRGEYLPATVSGCSRLADIRGVPAVSLGGGVVLFTDDSTVTIFDDKFEQSFEDSFDDGTGRDLRSAAEALRPVSGPADITKPLPAPVNAPGLDLLDTIATQCGAHPGDHGW
jgi:hypothetical protein